MSEIETVIAEIRSASPWRRLVERRASVLMQSLLRIGEERAPFNKELGRNIESNDLVAVDDIIYMSSDSIDTLKAVIEAQLKDGGLQAAQEIAENCYHVADRLIEAAKYNKIQNPEDAITYIENIEAGYARFSPYLLIIVFCGNYLDARLQTMIKKYAPEHFDHYYEHLTYTEKATQASRELKALLEIAALAEELGINDAKVAQMIDEHTAHYGWLGSRMYFYQPWSREYLVERINEYLKEGDIEHKRKQVEEHAQKVKHVYDEFVSKYYDLSNEDKLLIALMKEFVYLRSFRTEVVSRVSAHMQPFVQHTSERFDLSHAEVIQLASYEIQALFEETLSPQEAKQQAQARSEGFCYVLINDTHHVFAGAEKKRIEELAVLSPEAKTESSDIKGSIAWKGTAKGIAKIVRGEEDLQKVENGDILVAVMTFPHFVSAMERAAAFVTDEGGILCHAAIVAREMQKPCIIGTKHATQILKDGDLVEVDANNGTVKIVDNN